ncbi:MAG TPA: hypothetical protein VFZ23_14335 [Pyrinomonadaceae bacterium]
MQLKDAASNFGRVAFLLPLILIVLAAADSAYACPEHTSKVAYRTKAIKTRMVSHMPTTVISYRAPASYRRCGTSLYDTRGAKYVAMRKNGSSARFVAVRNDAPRTKYIAVRNYEPRKKYVAVRNVDFDDDDLHYVAIRRDVNRPEAGMRYIAVRSGYRKGNGIVAYIDDDPRYVAVRRIAPRTRYVAVRNIDIDDEPGYVAVRTVAPRTRYVAVRNINSGCTRAIALRSCLDKIETTSTRRVVLRDDDGYSTRTKHVVVRDEIDDDVYLHGDRDDVSVLRDDIDDDEYIEVAGKTPKYVEYRDATYSNGNSATYIAANDFEDTCLRNVAVRTCHPDALSTRTISYEVFDDDDLDDQAFFHDDGATYIAVEDMEDACLPRRVVSTSPATFVTSRAVRSVPAVYVDDDASLDGSGPPYIATKDAVPWPRYVALDDDRVFDDLDPTWVAEVEDTCVRQGAFCNVVDDVAAGTVNFVPVNDFEKTYTETVSYVPADGIENIDARTVSFIPVHDTNVTTVRYIPVDDIDVETVSYVPVDDIDVETVRYVPVDDIDVETVSYLPVNNTSVKTVSYVPVDSVDTRYVAADECPVLVSSVDAEPVYVANASTVLVEEVDNDLVAGLRGTQRIAGGFGYRDGFEDGQEAALEGDLYHPENSGDYKKATEGYEDEFGDKDVYKDAYRSSYLDGYRAGFESGASV